MEHIATIRLIVRSPDELMGEAGEQISVEQEMDFGVDTLVEQLRTNLKAEVKSQFKVRRVS